MEVAIFGAFVALHTFEVANWNSDDSKNQGRGKGNAQHRDDAALQITANILER